MVRRVTVDAGVLHSVVDGEFGRVHLEVFRRHDVEVIVPAPTLVECASGKRRRDARMNVIIRGCRVEVTTEQIARRAAVLRQRAGCEDAVIDALVVATSELAGGGALLTHHPDVCSLLAAPTNVRIEAL